MNLQEFNQFLNQLSKGPLLVIDSKISIEEYISIDISEKNTDMQSFDISSSTAWMNYIDTHLKKNSAKVAFGGYLEKRNLYNRSTYFNNQLEDEKRNIHLGIDLWCAKNTKVLAVLNGEVHSFKNNMNNGDYGPTIILKHTIKNVVFYTLYGHLAKSSLENLQVGDTFLQGETIGVLGDSHENGEYAPHLHFQIIRDLENSVGDYPGVASIKKVNFYKINCPNPDILLKLEKDRIKL